MAVRRTGIQILSLSAVAAVLGVGLAVIALGDRADASQAGPAGPATADVRFDRNIEKYDQVRYTAAEGQQNLVDVRISRSGGGSTITYLIDDSVEIRTGPGCTHPDEADRTRVSCTVDDFLSDEEVGYNGIGPSLRMHLRNQDDQVKFANRSGRRTHNEIVLGAGDDTFTTEGADAYDGSVVRGGTGNDTILARTGASVHAGYGDDRVQVFGKGTYASGDEGDDQITGDKFTQYLSGGSGDDVLRGGAGADTVFGGKGADQLYGGAGADTLDGNSGNDRVYGGSGQDRLSGGAGEDLLDGGTGKDVLKGGPGKDELRN